MSSASPSSLAVTPVSFLAIRSAWVVSQADCFAATAVMSQSTKPERRRCRSAVRSPTAGDFSSVSGVDSSAGNREHTSQLRLSSEGGAGSFETPRTCLRLSERGSSPPEVLRHYGDVPSASSSQRSLLEELRRSETVGAPLPRPSRLTPSHLASSSVPSCAAAQVEPQPAGTSALAFLHLD